MVKNFFDGLTETLTKTTMDLGKKANQIYETQKIQGKAASEAHQAEKLQTEIGVLIYKRYKEGEAVDGEIAALCEKIDLHMEAIARCKDAAANLKGCKICPSCGKSVDKEVSFCPYCGTPCPTPEPEKQAEDEWSCDWEDEETADEATAEEAGTVSETGTVEGKEEEEPFAEPETEDTLEETEKAAESEEEKPAEPEAPADPEPTSAEPETGSIAE